MKPSTYWIEKLELEKHPEGGFFKEVYRSDESLEAAALPERYMGERTFSTSIYFLLTQGSVSNFHRLSSDEIWHFHYGSSAQIHIILPTGELVTKQIGPNLEKGEFLQAVIPKNSWFAAEVFEGEYILVGCTVAPGFEFEDFELANRQELSSAYPQHQTLIARFTND